MTFILLCVVAIILFYDSSRISKLEKQVSELETKRQPVPPAASAGQPVSHQSGPAAPEQVAYRPSAAHHVTRSFSPSSTYTAAAPQNSAPNQFVEWLKEDTLVKLGGLLLLLAFGWFVSYAFANNWIGEAGRIMLGLVVGALFLVAGVWRMRVSVEQGSIFTVIGATTILLTIYAARELYDMFTPAFALGMMFVTVVFVAFVSLHYQRQALAIAGLLLGVVAPLLTAAPTPDVLGLLTYLLIIVCGTLWVVYVTGWTKLTSVALTVVFLYSLPLLGGSLAASEKDISLMYAFLFVTVFFVANIFSLVRRPEEVHRQSHIFTAIGTAIFLVMWVYSVAAEHLQSLLFVFWALVFGLGSHVVYRLTANRPAFYIYAGNGVALIGIATAAELSGPVLTIAFIVEIGVLLLIASLLRVDSKVMATLSFLYVLPVALSIENMTSNSWRDGIMHADAIVLLALGLSFAIAGSSILQRMQRENMPDKSLSDVSTILFIGAGTYAVILTWLTTHALFIDDLATLISLVIYTISGLTLFVVGKLGDQQGVKVAGAVLIGLVVARLLIVDVWEMGLVSRIITFLVIGIMLISTAFVRSPAKITNSDQSS